MKLEKIIDALGLSVFNKGGLADREVKGAYVSDLLSDVMGNAAEGQLWITLQAHVNVIAIASLRELSGIVLVRGIRPDTALLVKAEEEGIPVLGTNDGTFEISGKLYGLIGR